MFFLARTPLRHHQASLDLQNRGQPPARIPLRKGLARAANAGGIRIYLALRASLLPFPRT